MGCMRFWTLTALLLAPEGEGASGGGGAAGQGGAEGSTPAGNADMPAWAKALTERLDKVDSRIGDMGRQFGKLNEGRKAQPPTPTPSPKGQEGGGETPPLSAPSLSSQDVQAEIQVAMAYATARTQLGEAGQKKLDAMQAEGRSYAQLLDAATLALELGGAASNGHAPQNSPRGHGARPAAPTVTDAWPKTMSEAAALRKKDRAAYEKIEAQGFDITTVPRL